MKIAGWTLTVALAAVSSSLAACSSADPPPAVEGTCAEIVVDRFKELAIVEDAIVLDARASNATAGPWSFRHAVENMVPEGTSTGAFVTQWLVGWASATELNGFPLNQPKEPRADMGVRVLCPWLKRTAANTCNDDCSSCTGRELDLASAPFRLMGIFNRIDLRETDLDKPAGEGRLLFALTDGPGDKPESKPLPMSVIFEYFHPDTRSPKEWAEAWHALGSHGDFDPAYKTDLQKITDGFTKRGARAAGPNGGSALSQIRTNESASNWIWQLREFGLGASGLSLRPLHNTPAAALDNSAALSNWVAANADAIRQKRYELPVAMRGGSAELVIQSSDGASSRRWGVPGVDQSVRDIFAQNTCNGCHSQEHPTVDTAFHVSPYKAGRAKLSPFLNDPSGAPDELAARTKPMQRALCGVDPRVNPAP